MLIKKQKELEAELQNQKNQNNPKGSKNQQMEQLNIFKKKFRELQVTGDIFYDKEFPPEP